MFDRLFASGPGPWRFGHVYLPGGSRSLGASEWALAAPGSRAPTVGVLMEVSRAVRLMDGKLLVLATAVARIKVGNAGAYLLVSCTAHRVRSAPRPSPCLLSGGLPCL